MTAMSESVSKWKPPSHAGKGARGKPTPGLLGLGVLEEPAAAGAVAELSEGSSLDLADALLGDPKLLANQLKRHRLVVD